MAEQGGGGGRAISDQDFEYALQRVGKGKWSSIEQSIAKLDVLKQVATKDFIAAKIKSSEKYSQTHSGLAEHWMKYKESFETRLLSNRLHCRSIEQVETHSESADTRSTNLSYQIV